MQNNLKLIINISFTLCVFVLLASLSVYSNFSFHLKLLNSKTILTANIKGYTTEQKNAKSDKSYLELANTINFKNYERQPQKDIKNLGNPAINDEYRETIDDVIAKIALENPLFSGYYAQLGIFSTKEAGEEIVKILYLKGLLDENFTSYTEKKELKNKEVYFVEIGIFKKMDEAINFCNKLTRLNIACIVVE